MQAGAGRRAPAPLHRGPHEADPAPRALVAAAPDVFGVLVIAGSAGAFLAPPFTGLDTLPALGVVLLSLGVLLEDFLIVVLGIVVGGAGVLLEVALGKAAVKGIGSLF